MYHHLMASAADDTTTTSGPVSIDLNADLYSVTPDTTDDHAVKPIEHSTDADNAAPVDGLTPVQRRTLDAIRRSTEPVVFDPAFITELIAHGNEAIAALSERLGGEQVWVAKGLIARVHGCEQLHLQPDSFEWRPATAAGFVAHKAIELALNWRGEPAPANVVDEAIARIADQETQRGDFVAALTDGDLADLRGRAIERTTRFLQDFPPIPPTSHPMLEAAVKWRPAGTIEFSGKADLVIGRPAGAESRRLIIDFKSGGRSALHRDDLRFYALLETLSQRVPPRKLVTYYLDYSECETEDVTEGLLWAAMRRTLDAIERHIELRIEGRPPVKRVGAPCRWCPIRTDCAEGSAFLRGDNPFTSHGDVDVADVETTG
jgi:hypothetical protein